jgi:predicted ATPase
MPLPETSAGIVERHIEQLEPDQRAALEAASVCGLQFRISTVATAMAVDVIALAQPCVELARRGRWLREAALDLQPAPPDAAFMFRHALYREALYRRLAPRARMQLHHRVGIALERDRAEGHDLSAAEVARHLELGRQPAPTPSDRSSTILPVPGAVDRKAEMATTRPNSVQVHERARQLRAV